MVPWWDDAIVYGNLIVPMCVDGNLMAFVLGIWIDKRENGGHKYIGQFHRFLV